jgi:hypothetical protein
MVDLASEHLAPIDTSLLTPTVMEYYQKLYQMILSGMNDSGSYHELEAIKAVNSPETPKKLLSEF